MDSDILAVHFALVARYFQQQQKSVKARTNSVVLHRFFNEIPLENVSLNFKKQSKMTYESLQGEIT